MARKARFAAITGWLAGGAMGALFCPGCATPALPVEGALHAAPRQAAPGTPPPAAVDPAGFPLPEALNALGPEPSPAQLASLETISVERWDLTGPFPDVIGVSPAAYQGGFGAELLAFASQRAGTLVASADMACVARETGRFILARDARPPPALERHIRGRCGSISVRHHSVTLSGEAPETFSEDALLEQWRDSFTQILEKLPVGVLQSAGVWFGRLGSKVVVIVSSAERLVELEPLGFSPAAGGTVALKGKLLVPGTRLDAMVTRGRYQYGTCEVDPAVRLPRFSVRCAVSPEDPSAWLNAAIYSPGQVLGETIADLLLFPQGKGSASYVRPALRPVPGAPGASGEDGALFVHRLNGLRAELGLAPVTLSEGQSRVARKTAPSYFASASGYTSRAVADTVALGMMAGWEVGTVHRQAYFVSGIGAGDVGELLAEMLISPGARRALLAPEVRALAFGALRVPAHNFIGALVATYEPFGDVPPEVDAREVIDALNVARAERGVGPAELVLLPADTRAEMDKQLAARGSAKDALRVVLQRAVKLAGRSMNGSVLQAGSLEELPFPDELLRQSPLAVFVVVTHYRAKGEAWGRYVVVLAYPGEGERAPSPPKGGTAAPPPR